MNEESLFHQALAIDDPARREAFLDEIGRDQPALKEAVARLLAVHEQTGSFMKCPPVLAVDPPTELPAGAAEYQLPAEKAGDRIGPYKLLQKIGEGGMGTVWMAEQEHPVRRRVALKIIKPGMDSAQIVARFEAERQALAMMDHLNIAKVLDAGATAMGRPFFVMELVHGVPITRYCDENKLSPKERLDLFIPVCHAIQHAHQKGIIHRDIKPSNVLVTLYDGRPVPKVIDFGVAKAVEQRLTEKTMFTQYGQIVGTLEYMSPEQAEMSALGVDTRSDVYSLGVLLYELLTGTTPINRKQLREAAFVEILRIIKEDEPPRPSVRLSTTEELATIAASRSIDAPKLAKLVRGDLDWIVMKCLEKDRTRRYETASQLARDIEHYLKNEPVEACPPSLWYRWRKFTLRHKGVMTAATIAFWAIIGSQVITAWYAYKAAVANDSNRMLAQGLQIAFDNALEEKKRAEAEKQKADDARKAEADARVQLDASLQERTTELKRSEAWRLANIALLRAKQQPDMVAPLVYEALHMHDDLTTRNTGLMALQDIPVSRTMVAPLLPLKSRFGLERFANGWWYAFTSDGRYFLNLSSNLCIMAIYDAKTRRFQSSFPLEDMVTVQPSELVVSQNSQWLALAGAHQIHIHQLPTGNLLKKWLHPKANYHIKSLTQSRDGNHLAAIVVETDPQQSAKLPNPYEQEIWVWSAPNWQGKRLYATREPDLYVAALSSQGGRLAALHRGGQKLHCIDTANAKVEWSLEIAAKVAYPWLQFSFKDEAVCLPGPTGVWVYDIATRQGREHKYPYQMQLPNGSTAIVSADRRTLAITPYVFYQNLVKRGGITAIGRIMLWDLETLAFRGCLGEANDTYFSTQISADGQRVISLDQQHNLCVWDAPSLQLLMRNQVPNESSLAISPDGQAVAVLNPDKQITCIDLQNKGIIPSLRIPMHDWLVADQGKSLLVWDQRDMLWPLDTMRLEPTEPMRVSMDQLSYLKYPWQMMLAKGQRLLRCSTIGRVQLINTANGQMLAEYAPANLAPSKPVQWFLTTKQDGSAFMLVIPHNPKADFNDWTKQHVSDLVIYDASTGRERSRVKMDVKVFGFLEATLSKDGRWLAFIPAIEGRVNWTTAQREIMQWDAEQQRMADRFTCPVLQSPDAVVQGMTFSASSEWLAIWTNRQEVHVRHRAKQQWVSSIKVGHRAIHDIAVSDNGQWVAISMEGELSLWDVVQKKPVFQVSTQARQTHRLAFVADDAMLLSVGERMQLWPVHLKEHLERLGVRRLHASERQQLGITQVP